MALPPALANKLYEATPKFPLVLELHSTVRSELLLQTLHALLSGAVQQPEL